ncbi:hypothetical protein BDQ17DRAFT_1431544 [Cyathus striatus]|nr:hypothetical protein BDQ17DRAFT_1431544 [Cyathus striatus]
MPIPQNGPLSLIGYSRPGETAQSKPKHAMIVRMSAETLDALESFPNHPRLDFQLSDHPGIFIGETFFPMLPVKEEQPHEIYMRTSSLGKKSTPLKLFANVVGKFTVERQLGDKLTDKIRESTIDAANQRNNRTTILLDTPPPMPSKKRKDHLIPPSNMFRNKMPRTETSRNNTQSSTSTSNYTSSTATNSSYHPTKEALASLRQRMIHCIAVRDRTAEDLVKFVGGSNCSASIQRDIMERLPEIAESYIVKDKSARFYRLKPDSWREVRPYDWPRLDPGERTNMARAARTALKGLGIPESDPVWSYSHPRNLSGAALGSQQTATSLATNSTRSSIASEVPKRGITSKDVREKRTRVKSNPKAEIMMRDEGARAIQSNQVKSKVKELGEVSGDRSALSSTSVKIAPLRKPGSGFRTAKMEANEISTSSSSSKTIDTRAHKDPDTHVYSKPIASSSTSNNPERRANPVTNMQKIKKFRDEDYSYSMDSDKERRRDRDWGRERTKNQSRHQEKEEGEHSDEDSLPIKRKKAQNEDNSKLNIQKRRKMDTSLAPSNISLSNTKNSKIRDTALPKRPETAQQLKSKPSKEHSPLPPLPKIRKDPSPASRPIPTVAGKISPVSTSSSSTQTLVNRAESSASIKGHKVRRKSPIYTSSEDEGEILSSRSARREVQNSINAVSPERPSVNGPHSLYVNSTSRTLRPLPTDRAGLRARYRATYGAYLKAYQRMVDQRSKLDSMLESSATGSMTDSEGDVELLDTDALMRLANEHKKLRDELENIEQAFSKLPPLSD